MDLIRYASLAANSHNTQPWLFQVGNEGIRLLPDFARRTPVVDPDDHHLFVSLGCAAENLAISAEAMGYTCAGTCTDDGIMQFQLGAGVARSDPLFGAIARRQSTRALYDGRPVPNNHLDILVQSAMRPGVRVVLMTDARQIGQMRDLAVAGNNVQLGDPGFVGELKRWLRFNPRAAMAKGDGLYTACTGNPVLPDWLGPHAFDLFLNAKVENDKLARQIASSSGLAIFIGDRAGRASWVETGRACQRFLLTAAQLGLKSAFINQPVEVTPFRSELAVLAGEAGKRPDLVLRFGYGPTMPYAPRRPVSAVLI
ncbi:nitroreductase family protein [Cupriavidus basilensis]|uniref:Nitroreductase family protein n=1 Tax=Cupriavidus basilensis TaxID=68895 RepID=A0ABT6B527_9BURK|nr:nitroreductase family protein [Cupriavidus basilensis]MDF3839985.1 nitroreductase family protein [Cupriavidus basilensis]